MGFPVLEEEAVEVIGTAWHMNHAVMDAQAWAGDPTGQAVPDYAGQYCIDTVGSDLYWASSATSSGWKKLSAPPDEWAELDGRLNAPTGTPQFADLLDGVNFRPPWQVAGVDYRVGIRTGVVLASPETLIGPEYELFPEDATPRVNIIGPNSNTSGIDFKSAEFGGPWIVVVTDLNPTIEDCKFNTLVLDQQNDENCTGTTVRYCEFDSLNDTTDIGGGFQLWYHRRRGIHILEYCYLHDAFNDIIGMGDAFYSDPYLDKFQARYNCFANSSQGAGADHADWIQIFNPGVDLVDFTFNFGIQSKSSTNGTQGWIMDNTQTGQISYNTMMKTGAGSVSTFMSQWGGESRFPNPTTMEVQQNYALLGGSNFQYPGTQIHGNWHDNVDMDTGLNPIE